MRQGLQEMILLEAETLDELKSEVNKNIERAVALLYLSGDNRAAVVQILRGIANDLQDGVTRIILTAREQAASIAYANVVIEASVSELPEAQSNPEDAARATMVGMSFAAAWLAAALAAVVLNVRDIKRVSRTQSYRLDRIAATEVSEAYNQAALANYEKLENKDEFLKRWDATLDIKTCPTCRRHNGEEVPLDEDFSDGDEPGAIHARCRCQTTLIRIAADKAA